MAPDVPRGGIAEQYGELEGFVGCSDMPHSNVRGNLLFLFN